MPADWQWGQVQQVDQQEGMDYDWEVHHKGSQPHHHSTQCELDQEKTGRDGDILKNQCLQGFFVVKWKKIY